jgi:iron-sulfur cluster repair protein YtfE (RIC family)
MNECDLDTSVPDWVIDHPETLAVLQELGIDTCCGGKSLGFACRQRGLDGEAVLATPLRRLDAGRQDDCRGGLSSHTTPKEKGVRQEHDQA